MDEFELELEKEHAIAPDRRRRYCMISNSKSKDIWVFLSYLADEPNSVPTVRKYQIDTSDDVAFTAPEDYLFCSVRVTLEGQGAVDTAGLIVFSAADKPFENPTRVPLPQ